MLLHALKYKANGEKKWLSNLLKKKKKVAKSLDDLILLKYTGTRSLRKKICIASYLKEKIHITKKI